MLVKSVCNLLHFGGTGLSRTGKVEDLLHFGGRTATVKVVLLHFGGGCSEAPTGKVD
jgi:hypothetical protein